MDHPVNEDAQDAAWHRIEAALDRLERAGTRDRGADTALVSRLHDEQARHAALRHALRDTLGRLDALIASHREAGPGEDSAA